jgi:SagB-type dehydrogenase family enzyme
MNSIGREFIEKTKYKYLDISDQDKGVPFPPYQLEYDHSRKRIDLPNPAKLSLPDVNLRTAIKKRRSRRKYKRSPLGLDELSYILWCTQGVKKVIAKQATRRTVPSAGSRHAFETYLLINNVTELEPGLYRYLAVEHILIEENMESDLADKIVSASLDQKFIKSCAVTLIWVAVPYRMFWRYGERTYRYLYLDAGHVCQNLYLVAESLGCGACAIGAYDDDKMNELLKLDGVEKFVIYMGTFGRIR